MLSHSHFHILGLFDNLSLIRHIKLTENFRNSCEFIHKMTAVIFHLQLYFNDFAKF